MKIISCDAHDNELGDKWPDEQVAARAVESQWDAEVMVAALNSKQSFRHYSVVHDDYSMQPGSRQ